MAWQINKAILVPFDFSEHSHVAVDKALELAADKSKVYILHVLPPYVPMAPEGYPLEPIDDQLRLDGAAKAMQKEFADSQYVGTNHEVLIGDPGTVSADRASELGADLMIIASHGRSGLTRLLLGSVAERILRLAKCPVLVMKIQ
jgi:nucleotide-binding universal stress UspA family protein